MTVTYRDIRELQNNHQFALNRAQRAYLEAWGWRRTCNTPGSYWLWVRDFSDVDAQRRKRHAAFLADRADRGLTEKTHPYPKPMGQLSTGDVETAIVWTRNVLDTAWLDEVD